MFCPVSLLEIGLNIKTVLMDFKKEVVMDLTIKDLSSEQYDKILNFANSLVERKYYLRIFRDDFVDYEEEINLVFDRDEIDDVKILNCLKDYTLCKNYEVKNADYFDKEELLANGYQLFYCEATIHSGIWLYEYSGALRDRWDSGIAGIVAIKHHSKDVHFGHKIFKEFLEVWQKCSDGDFYGFEVYDNYGETIDCCSGFYEIKDIKEQLPDCITEEQFKQACDNIQY